jgi:hypothetical protein
MTPLHMKAGDTWPCLTGQVSADLTMATVKFIMYEADAALNFSQVLTRPARIVGDPAEGRVEYVWNAADTATPGRYFCVFRVTLRGGRVTSLPDKGYMEVRIDQ